MKRLGTVVVTLFALLGLVSVAVAAYQYTVEANGSVLWRGRSKLQSPADEQIKACNNAGTKCLFVKIPTNGQPAFYAANGTTYATMTMQHVVLEAITCSALPATDTTKHVYFVSDSGASDKAGLCVPDATGWLLADGSAACCP